MLEMTKRENTLYKIIMKKHIHFIGICGVAMSALAIAFHKRGFKVTGSDKGFYPPVSTNLQKNDITFYPGWHVDKMCRRPLDSATQVLDKENLENNTDYCPDLVVVGNVASSTNPEWLFVQEHNIKHYSYPEVVAEFLIKQNSIVCAGTYGKSTTSTLMTWIMSVAGKDPNYMIGGIPQNDLEPAKLTDSDWSIIEGDEYKSARWDMRPKFAHYSPTHLLLTAVKWDHADIYPTEKLYIETFRKLANQNKDNLFIISDQAKKALNIDFGISYGPENSNSDYIYKNISLSKTGINFEISHKNNIYKINSSSLGKYMADNITACFAMADQIGLDKEIIINAIASFKNIKRRLEKRFDSPCDIYDDIAHSPEKVKSILKTLKEVYSGKVIAIFEPNTGNRKPEAIPGYDNAFSDADLVIIPRLSLVKKSSDPNDKTLDGLELSEVIKKTHTNNNVLFIDNDEKLVETIKQNITSKQDDVIVFLGSHGFRGMIEDVSK